LISVFFKENIHIKGAMRRGGSREAWQEHFVTSLDLREEERSRINFSIRNKTNPWGEA